MNPYQCRSFWISANWVIYMNRNSIKLRCFYLVHNIVKAGMQIFNRSSQCYYLQHNYSLQIFFWGQIPALFPPLKQQKQQIQPADKWRICWSKVLPKITNTLYYKEDAKCSHPVKRFDCRCQPQEYFLTKPLLHERLAFKGNYPDYPLVFMHMIMLNGVLTTWDMMLSVCHISSLILRHCCQHSLPHHRDKMRQMLEFPHWCQL